MSMTKELWERSEPVNPQQQKDYRDFTKDINTYPRMSEDEEYEYFRDLEEQNFERAMNDYWDNFNQ